MSIAVRQVITPSDQWKVATGQIVTFFIQIVNTGIPTVLHPSANAPLVTLYNKLGAIVAESIEGIAVSTGLFKATFQVLREHIRGPYFASIIVEANGEYARVEKALVFTVTTISDFLTLSYQGIRDQEGNIWYWYIDNASEIVPSQTAPSFPIKVNSALPGQPYWFEIENDVGETRYLHPELDGTITVGLTEPDIGEGLEGSPIFVGYSGESYILKIDNAEQLYVQEI